MPETTAKLESTPPVMDISASIKIEEDSLRVKVKVAVSPILKVVLLELIVMEGAVVSMVMEIMLEAVFGLPAASVKVLAKTLMLAVAVVFVVGVKVAV